MAFTEFYAEPTGGNNLNGGSLNSGADPTNTTVFTYTSGTWVNATKVFTATGGSATVGSVGAVTNGDWACVCANSSTLASAGYWGRVTVSGNTITFDATAVFGTNPVDGTNTRTIRVGGRWAGPNTSETFPFGTITNAAKNSAGSYPRVNFKTGTYTGPTSTLFNHNTAGPTTFQGYKTTAGDIFTSGNSYDLTQRPTFAFPGTPSTAWLLLGASASQVSLGDCILGAGSSPGGTVPGLFLNGAKQLAFRVTIDSCRGSGVNMANGNFITDCEVKNANQGNAGASTAGIALASICGVARCYVHGTANSGHGFYLNNANLQANLFGCVADSCGGAGIYANATGNAINIRNCTFYNNASHQIDIQISNAAVSLDNNVIIGNGGSFYGVNLKDDTIVVMSKNTHFKNNGSGNYSSSVASILSENDKTWSGNILNNPSSASFMPIVLMGTNSGVLTGSPVFPATTGTNTNYECAGAIQPNRVIINN